MHIKDTRISSSNNVTFELACKNWDDFKEFIKLYKSELRSCLYRGQRNPEWELIPTLFRKYPGTDRSERHELSKKHLKKFKEYTRGKHTLDYRHPEKDSLEDNELWWALGQHYGLETPMLDWVYSPYVAAYFSFFDNDFVVPCACKEEKRANLMCAIHILDYNLIEKLHGEVRGGGEILLKDADPLMHENSRMVAQQGVFTIFHNSDFISIEEYLSEFVSGLNGKIDDQILHLKITIPTNERKIILEDLDQMNINAATLFPDLSGAAIYCNYLNKWDQDGY